MLREGSLVIERSVALKAGKVQREITWKMLECRHAITKMLRKRADGDILAMTLGTLE
jgi:hypothetical protein